MERWSGAKNHIESDAKRTGPTNSNSQTMLTWPAALRRHNIMREDEDATQHNDVVLTSSKSNWDSSKSAVLGV